MPPCQGIGPHGLNCAAAVADEHGSHGGHGGQVGGRPVSLSTQHAIPAPRPGASRRGRPGLSVGCPRGCCVLGRCGVGRGVEGGSLGGCPGCAPRAGDVIHDGGDRAARFHRERAPVFRLRCHAGVPQAGFALLAVQLAGGPQLVPDSVQVTILSTVDVRPWNLTAETLDAVEREVWAGWRFNTFFGPVEGHALSQRPRGLAGIAGRMAGILRS